MGKSPFIDGETTWNHHFEWGRPPCLMGKLPCFFMGRSSCLMGKSWCLSSISMGHGFHSELWIILEGIWTGVKASAPSTSHLTCFSYMLLYSLHQSSLIRMIFSDAVAYKNTPNGQLHVESGSSVEDHISKLLSAWPQASFRSRVGPAECHPHA